MTEKELLEKINDAAEKEPVPESLKPEHMKEKLRKEYQEKGNKQHQRSRRFLYGSRVAAAALVLLICGAAGMQAWKLNYGTGNSSADVTADMAGAELAAGMEESAEMNGTAAGMAETDGSAEDTAESAEAADVAENTASKQDAGDLYTVAKDYEEVYKLLKQNKQTRMQDIVYDLAVEGAIYEDSSTSGAETGASGAASDTVENSVTYDDTPFVNNIKYSQSEEAVTGSDSAEKKYSKTNLQTEGVDESDIIKTDGCYIYTVTGNRVIITDIRDGALEKAGEIQLALESTSDKVLEMYVDGDILNLIVQKETTGLQQETQKKRTEDVYYLSSDIETEIRTYDISDRSQPKLSGTMAQDGYYHTSRKIGSMIYLFTDEAMSYPSLTKKEAVLEENVGGWIPLVNGKAVAADCIYLSEECSQGLIISAVNVNTPDKVVDNTVILNGYVQIYVSTKAAYLYQESYANGSSTTQIAKFSLEDGKIDAVGAASVSGEVRDTFAINDYQGKLRVLTTDSNFTGGESTNQLYLFDEKLNVTGKLEGIAPGEEIYSARYFGDKAYFVTYRNTDPLFAVDLSDDTNPKILGELKITGFSEYLHFWGEDKLVGIGYETDPDTSAHEGLKITMFDISDPADLKEIKTLVLKNVDYSQALYDYKCVLADAGENLLGFTTEDYSSNRLDYLLFSWEDGKFVNLLTEKLDGNFASDNYRGIYVDNIFYVAGTEGIRSFDRSNDYVPLKSLEFNN